MTSARVMTDPSSGASRGYAFVRFSSLVDARRAVAEMNGVIILGRALRVSEATPRGTGRVSPPQRAPRVIGGPLAPPYRPPPQGYYCPMAPSGHVSVGVVPRRMIPTGMPATRIDAVGYYAEKCIAGGAVSSQPGGPGPQLQAAVPVYNGEWRCFLSTTHSLACFRSCRTLRQLGEVSRSARRAARSHEIAAAPMAATVSSFEAASCWRRTGWS